MQFEKRNSPRFELIGRVDAPELCIFPGTLLDISLSGCKIKFPMQITVDMDAEYELKILFSQDTSTKEMILIGQPVYLKGDSATEIGLKLLRSPGSRILDAYIKSRIDEYKEDNFYSEFTAYGFSSEFLCQTT